VPINDAMDNFFTLIQEEAIYLGTIVTIYTATLLTVNIVLICIISYFVLRNVRLVFPLCQHCAVGSCLVNSLPMGILKKIHKFYMKNEKSMALIENETEQKRILEQELESDSNSRDSESEESESDNDELSGAHKIAPASKGSHKAISFESEKASRHPSHSRLKKDQLMLLASSGSNTRGKRQSNRPSKKRQEQDALELVPLTRHQIEDSEENVHSVPAKLEIVSLTQQNLRQYVRNEMGSHNSLHSFGLSAAGASASNLLASESPLHPNGTHAVINGGTSKVSKVNNPRFESSPRDLQEAEDSAEDEGHEAHLSSVFASVRSDADERFQHGGLVPAVEPASLVDLGDLEKDPSLANDRTEDDELSEQFEETGSEEAVQVKEGLELLQAATDPQAAHLCRITEPEICIASGSDTSSDAAEYLASLARRLLMQRRRKAWPQKVVQHPRSIHEGLVKAGTGISRVAGALRSMMKQTSFSQHEERARYHPTVPATATPALEDGAEDETASFEDNVTRAAERQLAWYFRTSVYTMVLSSVLVFCFCVWLVPQRMIHQLINTALLMRCSRFTSVGISKSVFLIRELVLADGFSRAGPAALTARVQQSRDDLVTAISCFRLGLQVQGCTMHCLLSLS
jgi:hypothetical protein